ncbi:class D sortase [Cytobacillus sp. NCCP-133]|uniref:class D sortase n=1 Tax=Cytobacillus sp. NCCP-133 TaxID=766848 RepID=UPI0028134A02|nr:sortase [Cytobacillus sp. NCCP-133]
MNRLLKVLGIAVIMVGIWLIFFYSKPFFTAYKTTAITDQKPIEQNNTQPVPKGMKAEAASLYPELPAIGEEIGILSIPKISASLPIFHGTDEDELEKGVGHFAGSVLPGEPDNSVLSGHRDTVFRKLGEVAVGDLLVVTTSAGEFTYKIRKVRIVEADDRTVIVPKPRATLTVTTCYPFDFIGDAPQRYILVADLVRK